MIEIDKEKEVVMTLTPMSNKKYLIVMNGWHAGEGAKIFAVGLYNSWDEAVEVKSSFEPDISNEMNIVELEVGAVPKLTSITDKDGERIFYMTDKYLGGWIPTPENS